MMASIRFLLLVVVATAFAACANTPQVPPPASGQHTPVTLPAFKPGLLRDSVRLEPALAKLLALELLPIIASRTTHVTVTEMVVDPASMYVGVLIDFALEPQVDGSGICEEPHASIYYYVDDPGAQKPQIPLSVSAGTITNHAFRYTSWFGRYTRLPPASLPSASANQRCREAALDTSGWKQAASRFAFVDEEVRQSALIEAVQVLPSAQVVCIGIDEKKCGYDRAKLLGILKETPPDSSQEMLIPEQGAILVFRFDEQTSGVGTNYSVTLQKDLKGKPRSLHFRFQRIARPQI
jgi:hypothetical protein